MDYDQLVKQLSAITNPTSNAGNPAPSVSQIPALFKISFMSLAISFVYGAIGLYYLKAAKNGEGWIKGICGLALCVYPFFVSTTWAMFFVGLGFTLFPEVLERWG